jgi:hypothetical protein
MGVVIEICAKHPGGPTRITVTDVAHKKQQEVTASPLVPLTRISSIYLLLLKQRPWRWGGIEMDMM